MPRLAEDRALKIRLALHDSSPEVREALRLQFEEKHPGVQIVDGSVVEADVAAFICPGNSFGFMDSGLSLHVSEQLGWHLQDEVREVIRSRHDGEIVVGQALVHPTGKSPPWLVYTPTVRTPRPVDDSLNAFIAMRGALLAIRDHNLERPDERIESVAVPGLCTGGGGMQPAMSARQMRYAYELVAGLRGFGDKNLSSLTRRETKLRSPPRSAVAGEDGNGAATE